MGRKRFLTTAIEILRSATPLENTDELVFTETEGPVPLRIIREIRKTYHVRTSREKPGQSLPAGLHQECPGVTVWIFRPRSLRKCNICGKTVPPAQLEEFVRDLNYRHGYKNLCRICNRAMVKSYLRTNPEYRQRNLDKLKRWTTLHAPQMKAAWKAKRMRHRLIKLYGGTWQFDLRSGFPTPVYDPIAEEAQAWLYFRPGLSLEEVTAKEHGDKEFAESIVNHSGAPITQEEIDQRAEMLIARCPLPPISSPLPLDIKSDSPIIKDDEENSG